MELENSQLMTGHPQGLNGYLLTRTKRPKQLIGNVVRC